MYKKYLLSCIGLASFVSAAQADYLVDINAQLMSASGEYEYDDSFYDDTDIDESATALSATIFFSEVSTAGVPIREAAFLSKNSSVTFSAGSATIEYEDDFGDDEIETDAMGVSGRFVLPGSNIILIAGYSTGEVDYDFGPDFDIDTEALTLGAGWYINDRSSLTLTYTETEFDYAFFEDETEEYLLMYHQVQDIGSKNHLAFSVYAELYDDGDSYDAFTFGADIAWYFNRQLGAGVRLESISGEDDDLDYEDYSFEVSPFISYDFSDNFGLYGEFNLIAGEIDSDDGDDADFASAGITIGANARF